MILAVFRYIDTGSFVSKKQADLLLQDPPASFYKSAPGNTRFLLIPLDLFLYPDLSVGHTALQCAAMIRVKDVDLPGIPVCKSAGILRYEYAVHTLDPHACPIGNQRGSHCDRAPLRGHST